MSVDHIATGSPASPLLAESDKSFWHGYTEFYEQLLPRTVTGPIVEFGVFHGHSIRWLLERYPGASIHGADILSLKPDWPASDRVTYWRVDQADEGSVAGFLASIAPPALIIEDGSHLPGHQARCLRIGLQRLQPGGTYVLEDIHTSHPGHELYLGEFAGRRLAPGARQHPTVLSLLLCFEHLLRIGSLMTSEHVAQFATPSFMNEEQLRNLFDAIRWIRFYKRCTLPSKCYACNATLFDYTGFTCRCGVDLMKVADSTTVVIGRR